ncbi:hypothetical protein NKG05_28930 [Oerskovia sp. M15]
MLGVQRAIDTQDLRSRLLLQVHDELVVEVAPGSGTPSRNSCVERWAPQPSSRSRSTSRWARDAPGTTPPLIAGSRLTSG